MTAFAIYFGAGARRRYLAHAKTAGDPANGWRPLVWTKSADRAEKFGSADAARTFAVERLGHAEFSVGVVPGRGLPTDDLGGSPVAMRIAA